MAILQDVVAWYRFEDFDDSHHKRKNLTANGDATASDGEASFDGTGDYAQISTPIGHDFQIGSTDFCGSVWVNWDSAKAGSETVFVSVGNTWRVRKSTGERLQFFVTKDGGGNDQAQLTGPYSDSTWYHIVWWFDASAQQIGIRVNDSDEATTSLSDDVQEIVNNLTIGGAFGSLSHQGEMKQLVMRKGSIWSSAEITALYNSGTPLDYFDVDFNNEVQYNLDDANDTRGHRYDVLTATGSVTHTTGKVGNCADFSGTSQRYTSSDHIYKYIGDEDFCGDFWVNPDTLANSGLFGQDNNSWSIQLLSSGKIRFRLNTSGGAKTLDTTTTLSTGTWYYIYFYHDKTADEIGVSIDNAAAATTSTSGDTPVKRGLDVTLASIGSNNHFDGKIDEVRFRRGSLLTTTERDDKYNSGSGATAPTEIELDYNVSGSGAKYLRVQAKSSELSGTGSQTCYPLVITDGQLASGFHDSDDTTNVVASGGHSVRCSTSSDGSGQIPRHMLKCVPASSGGDVEIWSNTGTTDNTSGQDLYFWWIPGGGEKPEPPEDYVYGQEAVYNSAIVGAWQGGDFKDATSNDNDGTATNVSLSTSDVPFGSAASWDFDSSDSRVIVADDATLDLTSTICIMGWFKADSDTGAYQGLVTKRLGTDTNYSLAFDVGGNMDWNFYSTGAFRGNSVDFSTNFGTGTWYRVVATLDTPSNTDLELLKNTSSLDTDSFTQVPGANSETLKFGNIENVASTFTDFELDGKMKAWWILNAIPSDDILTTLDNNQTDPESFWDHTYTIQSVDSSGVTGTFSLTDGGETLSFSGSVPVSGTMTLTDGGETLSFSGTVPITGTMALTDGGETISFSGANTVEGTFSLTDSGESLSFSGSVPVSGTMTLTDSGETVDFSGSVPVSGTFALTDGGETLSFTNAVSVVARSPFKVGAELRIFTVYPNNC